MHCCLDKMKTKTNLKEDKYKSLTRSIINPYLGGRSQNWPNPGPKTEYKSLNTMKPTWKNIKFVNANVTHPQGARQKYSGKNGLTLSILERSNSNDIHVKSFRENL